MLPDEIVRESLTTAATAYYALKPLCDRAEEHDVSAHERRNVGRKMSLMPRRDEGETVTKAAIRESFMRSNSSVGGRGGSLDDEDEESFLRRTSHATPE